MTLHLKSRGYPFRPRLLFSSFIVVGVGSPNCVLFQERTIFENSSGEIEMSPLSPYYYNESAVQVEVAVIVISRLFCTFTEPKMRKCDLVASFALGINNITC